MADGVWARAAAQNKGRMRARSRSKRMQIMVAYASSEISLGVSLREPPKMKVTADKIAEKASRGEDISAYFTNNFAVVRPVERISVDLTQGMLRELDARAARLNISRQAVIKTLLGRALTKNR